MFMFTFLMATPATAGCAALWTPKTFLAAHARSGRIRADKP